MRGVGGGDFKGGSFVGDMLLMGLDHPDKVLMGAQTSSWEKKKKSNLAEPPETGRLSRAGIEPTDGTGR